LVAGIPPILFLLYFRCCFELVRSPPSTTHPRGFCIHWLPRYFFSFGPINTHALAGFPVCWRHFICVIFSLLQKQILLPSPPNRPNFPYVISPDFLLLRSTDPFSSLVIRELFFAFSLVVLLAYLPGTAPPPDCPSPGVEAFGSIPERWKRNFANSPRPPQITESNDELSKGSGFFLFSYLPRFSKGVFPFFAPKRSFANAGFPSLRPAPSRPPMQRPFVAM